MKLAISSPFLLFFPIPPHGSGGKICGLRNPSIKASPLCEPGSKLLVLGMVIQPLIGNPYNGYINPYYWVDDHPLLYGNYGSLEPSTCDANNEGRVLNRCFGAPVYLYSA